MKFKQPPSGGCVLKLAKSGQFALAIGQPPSGGCVLKRKAGIYLSHNRQAATFGWLCVETWSEFGVRFLPARAATFGWLCVETIRSFKCATSCDKQPPSGGCVLKRVLPWPHPTYCWQPPPRGCVLKLLMMNGMSVQK